VVVNKSNLAIANHEDLLTPVAPQKDSAVSIGMPGNSAANHPTAKKGSIESRFKIVKIESKENRKRGRWVCFDFADPVGSGTSSAKLRVTENISNQKDTVTNPAILVTPDPIYYFPNVEEHRNAQSPFAPAIVYNEGHPVLERNPLESQFGPQAIFRGEEWDSGGGHFPGGMYTPVSSAGVSFLVGGSSSNDSCYFSAEQIEGLNSNGGSSGDDLMTMLSKRGASPGSPFYANIVAHAMSPLTVNVGDVRYDAPRIGFEVYQYSKISL